MFPKAAWIHEHLVIETCRQEPAQVFVDRADVELKAWPMVLACRLQPFEKFCGGSARIGFKGFFPTQIDQCIGFFGAGSNNTARAVIFERTTHEHLVVRKQGRGQRVTRIAAHLFTVEGKAEGLSFVQQAAACGKSGAHERKSLCGVRGWIGLLAR